ncbi:MAG: hypothetical protein II098_00690 [Treponema sp.]|nr:hypothetical protein [Treponema sp.]
MKHSEILVLLGAFGYAVCLIADFILEFVNGIRIDINTFTNFQAFLNVTEDVTAVRFAVSGLLGFCSMILIALGMIGLYEMSKPGAPLLSEFVLAGGIGSAVLGAGFHLLYTLQPWFFITLGRSEDSFYVLQHFISAHKTIFILNPIFYTLMSITLFIILISRKTSLPRWSCVFNLLFLFFVLNALHVPGATSFAGLGMCSGILILSIAVRKSRTNNRV